MNEEELMVAYGFRIAERAAFTEENVVENLKAAFLGRVALREAATKEWADTVSMIEEHYTSLIPKTKRDRDRGMGPKVYEVHLALNVGRECFLLALWRSIKNGETTDLPSIRTATLRRLGILAPEEAVVA